MADARQSTDVDLARRIDLVCDRFEGNWRLGRCQTLETYLVSVESTERDAYLKALLELELELRRQLGEDPQLKEYLVRFLGDQAIVESLFEGGGKRDSLIASRPTVDSQVDQTNTGQRRQPGQVRQVVPTEFGRYRIKSQIGAGGMGTVVLAEDTLLGRPVALKIPYLSGTDIDEQIKRFDREARTAAMLRHPNICPIYDFGEINGIRYISMAYIEGLPLHKYAAENQLDERQIARLMWKLAGALQEAHDNGVVHRDLKPANIMVDKKVEPIVMDFGLAMQMQWEADVRLTQTGMQMGSPAYMPPEQVDGDKTRIGPAADIYSLGVVLYELLTGRIPFEGPTASIFAAIIMKEPIRPSMLRTGLSPEMEAICLKMMAKRIEDRYASMAYVATAMQEFGKQHVVGNLANISPASAAAEVDKTVLMDIPATEDAPTEQALSAGNIVIVDEEAELRLLMLDISNALRDHQTHGLLEKVERFLKLQPDNPAMRRLRKRLESERPAHAAATPRHRLVVERLRPILRPTKLKVWFLVVTSIVLLSVIGRWFLEDPERRAAKWVLSIGELVSVNGREGSYIEKIADLPKDQFLLTGIVFQNNAEVSDSRLAYFKNCKNLTSLQLRRAKIGDAGLAYFKDCKKLTELSLCGEQVTDVGLAYFKDCTHLTNLSLAGTKISDAGLVHFRDCKRLTGLELSAPQISDAGLAHFKNSKNLTSLLLTGPQISDTGLAHFKNCKYLTSLVLAGPQISDAGLAHFKDCKNLTFLDLNDARVSDAGLAYFTDCTNLSKLSVAGTKIGDAGLVQLTGMTNLMVLDVTKTRITSDGIKRLAAALPRCQIQWDGGVIEPAKTNVSAPSQTPKSETSATETATAVAQNPVPKTPPDVGKRSVGILTAEVGGAMWQYTTINPGPEWNAVEFDATAWASGRGGFGFNDGGGAFNLKINTPWSATDIWLRTKVTLPATIRDAQVTWRYYHDDNIEIFVNGQRVIADSARGTEHKTHLEHPTVLREGENVIAVHCHNEELSCGVDVGFDWVEVVPFDKASPTPSATAVAAPQADARPKSPTTNASGLQPQPPSRPGAKTATSIESLTLKGHTGWVRSMAFSADGKWLASGSEDQTVKVWDAASGQEVLTLKGHTLRVMSVAFSPDGKRLASAGYDGTVKVWDTASGEEVLTLKGHTDWVRSMAFSADGKWLASGSEDQTVKLWDAASGAEAFTLKGHTLEVISVAFSADGKRVASASLDQTVKVWDVASGEETLTFKGHNGPVRSVAFSVDGKRLASASHDRTVKVWDATSGQETRTLTGHTNTVTCVAFGTDGNRLVSASLDETVKLWDLSADRQDTTSGQAMLTFIGHIDTVFGVAFSTDGKRMASASMDKTVKVWDVTFRNGADADSVPQASMGSSVPPQPPTLKERATLKGHASGVHCVALSADGKRLASGSSDGTVRVWDADNGLGMFTLKNHTSTVTSVAISADGKLLASASLDQTVTLWDTTRGEMTHTLTGHTSPVVSVAFSADGKRLASASLDQTVKLWNTARGQKPLESRSHTSTLVCVAFDLGGQRLASASDEQVKVWDAASGKTLIFKWPTRGVKTVAFSANGKRLASAMSDTKVNLWDITTGWEPLTLKGHTGLVSSLAFNADGARLASASWDQTVKVWDARSGQETLTLKGHTEPVTSVAFSADGNRLASASYDHTVKVWDLPPLNDSTMNDE